MLPSHLKLSWWHSFVVYTAYVVVFASLNRLAGLWGTTHYYSLFFPGAGLRLAVLWLRGPRATPGLAISEAAAVWIVGGFAGQPDPILFIGSIVTPAFAYGVILAIARKLRFKSHALGQRALQFATAALLGPPLGFICSVPWHAASSLAQFAGTPSKFLAEFIVFTIGDFIGIVIVTPPILWIVNLIEDRRRPRLGHVRDWVTGSVILAVGVVLVLASYAAGFGIRLIPLTVAVAAMALRYGKVAAWIAVLAVFSSVSYLSAAWWPDTMATTVHLQLAGLAVMALVAGSYSDDQKRLRQQLRIREADRMHSERLKTLRAMSLAVIHELSQPLSTLSIETKYLAKLAMADDDNQDEIRTVSKLIAEKTENVATMLRRLRSFGSAPGEKPLAVKVEQLVRDVVGIVAPEAQTAGVRIEMRLKKDVAVLGQEMELQQALLNLLRNAIAASPGGTVRLSAHTREDVVRIEVINKPTEGSPYLKGMGVGKLIVQAIAEMHGGELIEERQASGERSMSLALPSAAAWGG